MARREGTSRVSTDGNSGLGPLVRLGLAPGLKEPLEQDRAFFGQDPALNFGAPMAGGALEKAGAMNHRAALGIFSPKDKPADTGMADGTGTHGAGLERHNEGQTG